MRLPTRRQKMDDKTGQNHQWLTTGGFMALLSEMAGAKGEELWELQAKLLKDREGLLVKIASTKNKLDDLYDQMDARATRMKMATDELERKNLASLRLIECTGPGGQARSKEYATKRQATPKTPETP